MRLLAVLLAFLPLPAADMEGWFNAEGPIFSRSRTELNLQTQVRLRESGGPVGYGRVGAISRTNLSSHLNALAGYYFEEGHTDDTDWRGSHRIFGGGELPFRRGRWLTQGRVVLEQFVGGDRGAFKRVRERVELGRAGKLNPYGSCEWLHDADGLQFTRMRGGISFQTAPWARLGFSYSYDARQLRLGGSRQFVLTTLEWERRP